MKLDLQKEYLVTVRQLLSICNVPSEISVNVTTLRQSPKPMNLGPLVDEICENASKIIEKSKAYAVAEDHVDDGLSFTWYKMEHAKEFNEAKEMSISLSEKMPEFFTLALLRANMRKDKLDKVKEKIETMIKWDVLCESTKGDFYFPWGKYFEGATDDMFDNEESPF